MKRWSATLLVLAVCSAVVHADVTIVQKMTVEGGAAAAAGGMMPTPTTTSRIKGLKGRTDIDMGNPNIPVNVSTITDAAAKQVIVLDHNQKTARVSNAGAAAAAPAAGAPDLKMDASIEPTGKWQTIDGFKCDEYTFTTSISMAEAGGTQMPPEALAMMKGVTMVMKGSVWVTKDMPGSVEYLAYQKAMSAGNLASAAMASAGMNMPGMDKMAKTMASVEGVPILTEMNMSIEGTGDMVEMMRQAIGNTKITTKVLSITTDAIGDDTFKVPEGYQVIK
jgi:hypothetical protein